MSECKECYRRERRRLGLCVVPGCDNAAKEKAGGGSYERCEVHHKPRIRKPKYPGLEAATKVNGRKHVLTISTFKSAKRLLSLEVPINEIARNLGVSARTIRRVANGEYDTHFQAAN